MRRQLLIITAVIATAGCASAPNRAAYEKYSCGEPVTKNYAEELFSSPVQQVSHVGYEESDGP